MRSRASGRERVEFKARPNTPNALLDFQPAAELLNYSESSLLSINARPGSEPGNPGAPARREAGWKQEHLNTTVIMTLPHLLCSQGLLFLVCAR